MAQVCIPTSRLSTQGVSFSSPYMKMYDASLSENAKFAEMHTNHRERKPTMSRNLLRLLVLLLVLCGQVAQSQSLMGHITVNTGHSEWMYTLVNDEQPGSPNFITAFYLTVSAPVLVTLTPAGWDFQTDGESLRSVVQYRPARALSP